jgi:hypothetical protein
MTTSRRYFIDPSHMELIYTITSSDRTYFITSTLEGFHPTRQGSPLDSLASTLYPSRVNP